jgi:nitrite reductase/ring-hydroxylating ferredoxin subunit
MPHVDLLFSELTLDTPFRVKHEGVAIVVILTESGVYAYKDVCPHALWPLSKGAVSAGVLKCPGHGWEFRVETGRCLNVPAYCLNVVSVILDDNTVRLNWENQEQPNRPAAIDSLPVTPSERIGAQSIAPSGCFAASERS